MPGGKVTFCRCLHHLLARKIIVGVVGKGQVTTDRPVMETERNCVMCGTPLISRSIGRVTLRSTSSGAWPGTSVIDLHLHVLHIGEGLDRQILHRAPADDQQHQRGGQHKHPLLQGEGNEFF